MMHGQKTIKKYKYVHILSVTRLGFEDTNQFVHGYKVQMLVGLFLKVSNSNIAFG
jgi:hypothetical protein